MKSSDHNYLTLDNGQKVRIVFNMNAVNSFTESSGIELTALGKGATDVATLRKLLHACASEGERLDGRQLLLTEIELGGLMSIRNMTEFSEILSRQGGMQQQKKSAVQQAPWWTKVRKR